MQIYSMRFLSKWLRFILTVLAFLILVFFYVDHENNKNTTWVELTGESPLHLSIKSYCSCRPNLSLQRHDTFDNVYKKNDYYLIFDQSSNDKQTLKKKYGLDNEKVFSNPRFTCDLDRVLSHGPNKKVLGYAYYGKGSMIY